MNRFSGKGFPVFLGILALSLFSIGVFISGLEQEHLRQARLLEEETLREILARFGTQGNLQRRFNSLFDRITRLDWTIDSFAERAEKLLKDDPEFLDLYLFNPEGKRIPIHGRPESFVFASQQFLQALKEPERPIPPKLISGFGGNADAARLMTNTPGTLVDLLNGDRKTFGGWWKITDRLKRRAGDLIVFLHRSGISPDDLLDRAAAETNALTRQSFQFGWFDPARAEMLRPESMNFPRALARAIFRLPPGKTSMKWNNRTLVLYPNPSGEILFGLSRKPIPIPEYFRTWRLAVSGAAILLALLGFRIGIPATRLKHKLVWLFGWGSAVPLMIFLGTVLLNHADRETLLISQICNTHLERLSKIDHNLNSQYLPLLREYDHLFREIATQPFDLLRDRKEQILGLIQRQRGFLTKLAIIDRSGRTRFFGQYSNEKAVIYERSERETLPVMAHNILRIVNQDPPASGSRPQENPIAEMTVHSISPELWLDDHMVLKKNFAGKDTFLSYFHLIPGPGGKFRGIIFAAHDPNFVQKSYLRRIYRHLRKKKAWLKNHVLALPIISGGRLPSFPDARTTENTDLHRIRDLVVTTGIPQHQYIWNGPRKYLVSAMKGQYLNGYVLMLVQPYSYIQARTTALLNQALGLSFFMFFLAGVSALLTGRFLLPPITELETGLVAITDRRFRHRVPAGEIEDLSHLAARFNLVLANLGELDVAKTIQEKLWPGGPLIGPDYGVWGRCLCASNIGGDYHDWFRLEDGRVIVVVGDVAGHGIPAGLVTASLKTALILLAEKEEDPAVILTQLNETFREQAGRMRPTTLWLGIFDFSRSTLRFANAGACFPVLDSPSQEPVFLEAIGYPIGSRKNPKYVSQILPISGAFRLSIFTDGIPESFRPDGTPYGYSRLLAKVCDLSPHPPLEALDRLFATIADWSGRETPEDDQTMVIVEYRGRA